MSTTSPHALSPADQQHRAVMRAALHRAARQFSLSLTGRPIFGWQDRSIGAKARTDSGEVAWLRVGSELATWAYGESWEGNKDAAAIRGVRKPQVRLVSGWSQGDRHFRAEVMTYVAEPCVSATPELHDEPRLPGSWWISLRSSLDALSGHPTARLHLSQQEVTRRLRQYFADRVEPVVNYWVTAHNDLHWNNLTRPDCYLLDWEGWGLAPAGYDAATLYCHSLLIPGTAARVYAEFVAELETPDGKRSQLLAITRMLDRSAHGDYPELVVPLHELAGKLTGR
jgi:hypothetical protein